MVGWPIENVIEHLETSVGKQYVESLNFHE